MSANIKLYVFISLLNTIITFRLPASPTQNPPLTPLYDSLTTNLPHPVMAYTSFSFPPSTPLFPPAATVQTYLEAYAANFDLLPHIHFRTSVHRAHWNSPTKKWRVQTSAGESLDFDLVIVANGHYRVPRYPDVPGISDWLNSRRASHSAWYRHPHNLGDVVLVVGAGPSGQDIAAEMRSIARTVIHSTTGGVPGEVGNLKRRGRVVKFEADGQVSFEDGTTETGIDHCILATGYDMSFPFLSPPIIQSDLPPPCPPLPGVLHNSGYHVFPLAEHLFPLQDIHPPSSLVFMGLLMKVAPLPLLEAQARAVMKAFGDPSSLDTTQEAVGVVTRYEELRLRFGGDISAIPKNWHKLTESEQFSYRDRLYEFAESDDSPKVVVPDWEKEMYAKKDVLRTVWRDLEASGEANEWVEGVGEGGLEEWVDLMRRLVRKAEGDDKSKL